MGQSPDSKSYNKQGNGLPFYQGNADFGDVNPITRVWSASPIKIAEEGDILISVRAPIGAMNIATTRCCIGRGLAALRPIDETFDNQFLFYALQSRVDQLIEQGTGSTFKAIGKSILEHTELPCYPLESQIRIVDELNNLGKAIDIKNVQLTLLDEIVKSRFIEMFGDPVDNPKHWDTFLLKNLCTKLTDGTHYSPKNYPNGDYLYVTAKNIKPDGFDFTNITYVSREVHDEIYARCNPEYGDVLYIKDGVTTGIAMINTLHEPFSMLSSVALIKYNRNILNGLFLCSVLNDNHMYETIRNSMDGAAITRLTISKLNKIKLPVPPLTLQKQFASFVEQVDKSKYGMLNRIKSALLELVHSQKPVFMPF